MSLGGKQVDQNGLLGQVFEQYADSIIYSFAQGDLCFDKRSPGNSIGYSGGRHLRCRAHDRRVLDSFQKAACLPGREEIRDPGPGFTVFFKNKRTDNSRAT